MSEKDTQQTSTKEEATEAVGSGKLEKIVAFMAFGLGAIAVNSVLPKKFKLSSDDLADLIAKFSLMDFCQQDNKGQSIFEELNQKAQDAEKNKTKNKM